MCVLLACVCFCWLACMCKYIDMCVCMCACLLIAVVLFRHCSGDGVGCNFGDEDGRR